MKYSYKIISILLVCIIVIAGFSSLPVSAATFEQTTGGHPVFVAKLADPTIDTIIIAEIFPGLMGSFTINIPTGKTVIIKPGCGFSSAPATIHFINDGTIIIESTGVLGSIGDTTLTNNGTIINDGSIRTDSFTNEGVCSGSGTVSTVITGSNVYNIAFDENYSGAPAATPVNVYAASMSALMPANPVRTPDYQFREWNTLANGTGTAFDDTTLLSSLGSTTPTVYAQWNPQVTMAAGVNSTNTSTTGFYKPGDAVNLSAMPDGGYKFKEWQSSVAGIVFANVQNATTTFTMPDEPVTITPVFEALATDKAITSFILDGKACTISGTNISLTVPHGTDVTGMTPSIVHTGASISPSSGTPRDFTNPVTYTVTAADGTTQVYAVTVTVDSAPQPPQPPQPTKNPEVSPTTPISLDLNGTKTANLAVALGQSGGGTMAQQADISSDNTAVGEASPAMVTSNSNVTVTAKSVGSATITVTFDTGKTVAIPVTVTDSTPINPPPIVIQPGGNSSGNYTGSNTPDTAPTFSSTTGSGSYTGGNGLPAPGETVVNDPAKTGVTTTVSGKPAVGVISAAPGVKSGATGSPQSSTSAAGLQTAYTKAQFEKDFALALANRNGKTAVLIRAINYSGMDASVLDYAYAQAKEKGVALQFHFDEVVGRNTHSRLYLTPTQNNSSVDLMGDKIAAAAVVKTFSANYSNPVMAVSFENSGSTLRIAAEIPDGVKMTNPVVYSYNAQTGTYTKVTNAKVWLDKNGYVHFTAPQGTYVISGGELAN